MRWLRKHKFTIAAVILVVGGIWWLAAAGGGTHQPWFWQHPWWWYLIWAGGIMVGSAIRAFRPKRGPRSTLWDGDPRNVLPCPPDCHIKVSHIHERPHD